jgi:hypothetical protein
MPGSCVWGAELRSSLRTVVRRPSRRAPPRRLWPRRTRFSTRFPSGSLSSAFRLLLPVSCGARRTGTPADPKCSKAVSTSSVHTTRTIAGVPGDASTPCALFAACTVPSSEREAEDPKEVAELFKGWKTTSPDVVGTVTSSVARGHKAALKVIWKGTHTGPLTTGKGERPNGRPLVSGRGDGARGGNCPVSPTSRARGSSATVYPAFPCSDSRTSRGSMLPGSDERE